MYAVNTYRKNDIEKNVDLIENLAQFPKSIQNFLET